MVFFVFFFTAFIQSDTILEVLHFGEGSLLQVGAVMFDYSLQIQTYLHTVDI